jgi:hypothetical protein
MAGISKVLFFINDGGYGWSESYYDTAANVNPIDTLPRAQALAAIRAAALGFGPGTCPGSSCSNPTLVGIRISTVGQPRNTIFSTPNGQIIANGAGIPPFPALTPGGGATAGPSTTPDNPYSAIEMLCLLANGQQAKRALSGVPDAAVCDQLYNPNTNWFKLAQAYAVELTSGRWGSLSQLNIATKLNPPPGTQIISLGNSVATPPIPAQNEHGQPYIRVRTPLNFGGSGSPAICLTLKMVVWGYVAQPCTPNLNGVYRAVPIDVGLPPAPGFTLSTDTFLLRRSFPPLSDLCLGYASPPVPLVLAFSSIIFQRPMKKDRGRPFGLVRGRARKRLIA